MCPAILPFVDPTNSTYPPDMARAMAEMNASGMAILTLPVGLAKTDAEVLYTVPAGKRLLVGRAFWEVTTAFTGGAAAAIGLSSSNAAYNTKGDLLGGAAGDLLAALTAGFRGAVGAKLATSGLVVLIAADTIRFDRIVSAFTAGAGFAHIPVQLVPAS